MERSLSSSRSTFASSLTVCASCLAPSPKPRVKELIEDKGCELIYLPPYSPEYNPIEQAFSKLKGYLRAACARSQKDADGDRR